MASNSMEKRSYRYETQYQVLMADVQAEEVSDPDTIPANRWSVLDHFPTRREAVAMAKEYRTAIPGALICVEKHRKRIPA